MRKLKIKAETERVLKKRLLKNQEVDNNNIDTLQDQPILHDDYSANHYVPQWYQKRFILPGQINNELYYLDLKPETFTDPRGVTHEKKSLKHQGFRFCFVQKDLYTINLGSIESKEIEKYFFGYIDNRGQKAVEYFTNFQHPSVDYDGFSDMIMYMSTQKLRTPKGLDWLSSKVKIKDKNAILASMLRLRQLYGAIWSECIWLIADASQSNTKFIISDHPVTVYNRICGPRSERCRGFNDPDIWLNGTHTIFPLTLDKILILTNLSWVRNPYQSPVSFRPNPNPFRGAIFKFTDIQTLRHLTEQEVIDINYIIKKRAYRYVAAAKEEWLYPENKVSTSKWNMFGDGYLLMPDPRAIHLGGEVIIGHNDGTVSAFDPYGRRPWQKDYNREESKDYNEGDTLYRFQGEFSRLYGPYRKGRTFFGMSLDKAKDDAEFHQYHLDLEIKHKSRKNNKKI